MPIDPVALALQAAQAQPAHTGPIPTDGPGRTDNVNMSVPGESFVIPADVVSALGQGNTAAGFRQLDTMFPRQGPAKSVGRPVPIVSAGGEYVVGPDHIARYGGGNLANGHKKLRAFVQSVRKKHIKTLKKLPGPARG